VPLFEQSREVVECEQGARVEENGDRPGEGLATRLYDYPRLSLL